MILRIKPVLRHDYFHFLCLSLSSLAWSAIVLKTLANLIGIIETVSWCDQGAGTSVDSGPAHTRRHALLKCYAQLPDLNKNCIDFLLNHFVK